MAADQPRTFTLIKPQTCYRSSKLVILPPSTIAHPGLPPRVNGTYTFEAAVNPLPLRLPTLTEHDPIISI
jgi:hypothetical protein